MTSEQKLHIKVLAEKMQTREDLLEILNEIKTFEFGDKAVPFKLKQLTYHCNPKLNKNRYVTFKIPKKSGGERTIMSPNKGLRMFQFCVNKLLQVIYTPNRHAFGFVEGRSIVDGAKMHIKQNYIFNTDLKDFFPSIDQARVWKRLQYPPFNFTQEISSIIAGLCCQTMEVERIIDGECKLVRRPVLPQGAPTSPILTNIICDRLDRKLQGLAKRFNLCYTRYADDITFSSMHNVYQENGDFRNELKSIIEGQNFRMNFKKTRLQGTAVRQEVTGLIVSDTVSTTRKYVKQLRMLLHIWEKFGYKNANLIFKKYYKENKNNSQKSIPNLVNVFQGKLDFLKMVKGSENSTYLTLLHWYESLIKKSKISFLSPILDIWEKEGLDQAMKEFYNEKETENIKNMKHQLNFTGKMMTPDELVARCESMDDIKIYFHKNKNGEIFRILRWVEKDSIDIQEATFSSSVKNDEDARKLLREGVISEYKDEDGYLRWKVCRDPNKVKQIGGVKLYGDSIDPNILLNKLE